MPSGRTASLARHALHDTQPRIALVLTVPHGQPLRCSRFQLRADAPLAQAYRLGCRVRKIGCVAAGPSTAARGDFVTEVGSDTRAGVDDGHEGGTGGSGLAWGVKVPLERCPARVRRP